MPGRVCVDRLGVLDEGKMILGLIIGFFVGLLFGAMLMAVMAVGHEG